MLLLKMLKLIAFAVVAVLCAISKVSFANAASIGVDATNFVEPTNLVQLPNITTFDMDAYKKDHRTQVCLPYKNAISFLADNLLQYLATAPVPKFAIGGRKIAKHLNTQAQSFSKQLGTVSNSSTVLLQRLDHEVEDVVSEQSAYQTQIRNIDRDMQSIEQQIWHLNAQIKAAQTYVDEAAKNNDEARKKFENAFNNYQKLREKRKGICIWTVGGNLCDLNPIHSPEFDRASADYTRTQNILSAAYAELTRAQSSLTSMNAQKSTLQTTRNGLTNQVTFLQRTRNTVNDLDTKLKAVIVHVQELFGESIVFIEVVKNLIDMATIIDPLTSIADKVMDFTPDKNDATQLEAIKEKINVTLPLVEKKLAQYQLIPPSRWA